MTAVIATAEEATNQIVSQLRAGKMDEAVAQYTQYREDLGYLLLNRAGTDAQMQKVVANLLYRARDYDKAATCCENLGELDKAAGLYALSENYPLAAEMFTRIGQPLRAAEMFEKARNFRHASELYLTAGDQLRAAQCAERAGESLRAGALFAEQGRHQQALEVLQKVKRGEPDFLDAALLVARLLEQSGHADLAARRLKGLREQDNGELNAGTARMVYALAELAQKRGALAEAKAYFGELVAWDFSFKDARARLDAMNAVANVPGAKDANVPGTKDAKDAAKNAKDAEDELETVAAEPLAEAASSSALVSVMEGFEFLKQLPLFETLSLTDLRAFYHRCETVQLAQGDVLIQQGVPGAALYVLTAGTLEVCKLAPSGERKVVAHLPVGSYVGEMGLVDDGPTSAQVRAASAGTALRISRADFEQLLGASDRMALAIYRVFVRTLSERLRATTAKLS